MRRSTTRALLLVTAIACGCSQGASPASPKSPEAAELPRLLTHVPADTPYVVAALEALPPGDYVGIVDTIGPTFTQAMEKGNDPEVSQFVAAIREELGGPWTSQRFEALGFSATPRFVIYGIGLLPVIRIEVKDSTAVLATIQRIAARIHKPVPPALRRGAVSYWRSGDKSMDVLVALADHEIVFALGSPAKLDAALDLILGTQSPAHSLADGKRLHATMARHGLGTHLVGEVDTRLLLDQVISTTTAPAPVCRAKLETLTLQLPRLVFGHRRSTARVLTAGVILELGGDLVGDVRALHAMAAGFTPALHDHPIVAMAGGVDLTAVERLGHNLMAQLRSVGDACDRSELRTLADAGDTRLAVLGTDVVASLTGFAMALYDVAPPATPGSRIPARLDALAMVATTDAPKLFATLTAAMPFLSAFGLTADNALHEIGAGRLPVPFPVFAGVGDHAIVVATGEAMRERAEATLADTRPRQVPLLVMMYDYGRFLVVQKALGLLDDPVKAELYERMARVFGRANMTIDIAADGLSMWTAIEEK